MKKLFLIISLTLVILCTAAFCGCSLFGGGKKEDNKVYEVSSAEELAAMEKGKNYKLTADIDLKNGIWTPLDVKSLDGDGHTISNALVTGTSDWYANGFIREAHTLKNVTFDNIKITLTVSDTKVSDSSWIGYSAGGIAVGECYSVDNVTVKNSKATYIITWTAGYSKTYDGYGCVVGWLAKYGESTGATSCSVTDCELSVTTNLSHSIYVGGVVGNAAGAASPVSDCYVENTTVTANTSLGANVGGVVGTFGDNNGLDRASEKISNCYARACVLSGKSGSEILRMGGVVGYVSANGAQVNGCASVENEISGSASVNYNIGGISARTYGSVRDCLSDGNTITCAASATGSVNASGLVSTVSGSVVRCVSQNNTVSANVSGETVRSAGLASNATGSLVNSAVKNNTVEGGSVNAFASGEPTDTVNCFIGEGGTVSPKASDVTELDDEGWELIFNQLELDGEVWAQNDGVLTLKILG